MAANTILYKTTSITLNWDAVSGANKYQLQVSARPDFGGTLMVDDATLASATKSFTDSGANNSKRWWRFRSSANGGTTWAAWHEVAHYWINTGAAAAISTGSKEAWVMADPLDTTDVSAITPFPRWKIVQTKIPRGVARNRAGDLLSEYITLKDVVGLSFPEGTFLEPPQRNEFERLNGIVKTFFLICYKRNGTDLLVPKIWKGQFQSDPEFELLANGNFMLVSDLAFEEA